MKKLNFVWLMILVVLMGACESEVEKDAAAGVSTGLSDGGVAILPLSPETRAGGTIKPLWATGEKVGLYLRTQGLNTGPLEYTIQSTVGGISFVEPVIMNNPLREHTYYAYHPFHVNTSTDPARVNATPVPANQVQAGASDTHKATYEYNIAEPAKIYPANEQLRLYFATTYTFFQFQISAEMNGVNVTRIELEAPNGKLINFTSAKTDITKYRTDPEFAQLFDLTGGNSKTTLSITSGGLNVPNSTTSYAAAYIVSVPFDCTNQKLNIKVTTSDNKTYTFEENGTKYNYGQEYIIPLRITKGEVKPVPKDFRILSFKEVGCLGEYTNHDTKCHYGATHAAIHAKAIRRLIHEHFGPGKTVPTGTMYFDKWEGGKGCCSKRLTRQEMEKYSIIFMNNNTQPDMQVAKDVMDWLAASPNRVLMLAYDWKDACLTSRIADAKVPGHCATNNLIFRHYVKSVVPHWYNGNTNYAEGNYGACRDQLLVPFELNSKTSYFWKEGPFKTTLNEGSDQRYFIEDLWWGAAQVNDPNVIPLITYRDARASANINKQHCKGPGDGGMVLGVDPEKRIVYVGDSEIFSLEGVCKGAKQDGKMVYADCGKPYTLNNYSKIMGNLWAWMTNIVQTPK